MKKLSDPIDQRERKQGSISSLLDNYMSKFVVHESPRMFDLDDEWQLIKKGICPVCACNLKLSMKGDVYCNSKKHLKLTPKRLFIRSEKIK